MNEAVGKEFERQRREAGGLGEEPARPVGGERGAARERKEKLGHMSGKGSANQRQRPWAKVDCEGKVACKNTIKAAELGFCCVI